ncbi:MAG: hypothetical protein JWP29_4232, partial [Rhodoferax sp.]|nr:hypothetical protein [Rhodoferax sp.]
RWLFQPWRRLMPLKLVEHQIKGLHGSIFEVGNVHELATVVATRLEETPVPPTTPVASAPAGRRGDG